MKDPRGAPENPLYLIPTWTRHIVQIDKPQPEDFCIEDIAHALPMLCRWGAQGVWVSVAAHSLAMAKFEIAHGNRWALEALLHDGAEAYLGDTIGPLRRYLQDLFTRRREAQGLTAKVLAELEEVHENFNLVLGQRFKLPCLKDLEMFRYGNGLGSFAHLARVKYLDNLAMQAEVYMGFGIGIWDMPDATNDLGDMYRCLGEAMKLEAGGSPEGREAIEKEFIVLFKQLER
jgi:hypothetical protein